MAGVHRGWILGLLLVGCGADPLPLPRGGLGDPEPNPYAGFVSPVYDSLTNWLCHPDLPPAENVCAVDLDTFAVFEDGRAERWPHAVAEDPPIDCFYVYPTTSADPSFNADRRPGPQEIQTTQLQAARYTEVCRVFAPVYRQRTLTALALGLVTAPAGLDLSPQAAEIAYADVLDAWRSYMAGPNAGRGVLLIGHSQGAGLLRRLVAEEIEPTPYAHERLVAAHLLGNTILVPVGADVGGSFAETPACRHPAQWGCVVSFASYRAGDPELSNPRFGVSTEPGMEALCNHPAALSGGPAPADARLPFRLPPVFELLVFPRGSGGPYADRAENRRIPTRYFAVPGQIEGECLRTEEGAHILEIRIAREPGPRADDYPGEFLGGRGWGLHLADVNLVQGDLVRLAGQQAAAWLQRQEPPP